MLNTSRVLLRHWILKSVLVSSLLFASTGCQQEVVMRSETTREDGLRLYQEGQYADAAGTFRTAVRRDPRDYRSQFHLGQSYEQLKQHQQAIQAYKASLDAQPRTLAGAADEAQRVRTTNALAQCIARIDNRDAETNLIEQQAKGSQNAREYYLLAKIHQYGGDLDSAIDSYNRAAILNPKDFQVQKDYGLLLEQLGQKPKASQTLKRAYTLNNKDAQVQDALRRLGVVPGPSLKDEAALVPPHVPKGPLPEVDLSKFRITNDGGTSDGSAADATAPGAAPTPGVAPALSPSAAPSPSASPPPPAPAIPAEIPRAQSPTAPKD